MSNAQAKPKADPAGSTLYAQTNAKVDLAITFTVERGNPVGDGGKFWLQGGSVEAGINVWRGLLPG